jgi:hypothetical protein
VGLGVAGAGAGVRVRVVGARGRAFAWRQNYRIPMLRAPTGA